MGLTDKMAIKDYWTTHEYDNTTTFSEIMSQNRYKLISRFMLFNSNSTQMSEGKLGYDLLYKVRPKLDLMMPLF